MTRDSLQAKAKGSSSGVTGVIVSASPFSVFVLSPVVGYLVSSHVRAIDKN